MKTTREQFEEIWPVPDVIFWSQDIGRYAPMPDEVLQYERLNEQWAHEHNARLETFTRCQETMSQKVIDAIRDVCELEQADASNPECLIVTATDLGIILSRHFEGVE